jgi:hypothetical protein
MSEQETATAYDFWCALWLLSCAVGRDVIVDRPRAPVYLNLYALLIANSGVTRKSAAVSNARSIANDLFADDPMMGLLETKTTPEKLDSILHDRSTATGRAGLAINVSELATFLGTERYNSTMPALLTDLYDCATQRRGGGTVTRGAVNQSDVFVNFLSASTPSWLLRSVNPNVVAGGFTSRCIFVCSEKPKRRIAWSDAIPNSNAPLVRRLRIIRTQGRNYGKIGINDAALRAFRQWYGKRKGSLDAFRSSFESREDAHILRLAAFLCINDDTWIIQHSHLQTATKLIAETKEQASKLFEGGERSKFFLGVVKLQEVLIGLGLTAIPQSQLYLKVRNRLDAHEFAALLDVMHEIGAIQRFNGQHEGAGRPAVLIRGTKLLTTKGIIERIVGLLER